MGTDPLPQSKILELLGTKAGVKAAVFDQALEIFNQLKDVLSEMSNDLNESLDEAGNKRIKLENAILKAEKLCSVNKCSLIDLLIMSIDRQAEIKKLTNNKK